LRRPQRDSVEHQRQAAGVQRIEAEDAAQRHIVDALLRLDLGARIRPGSANATLDIEGRFAKTDLIAD
jgi:hypothetical protein